MRRLLVFTLLVASICLVQVSKGDDVCTKKPKCRRFEGECTTDVCDEGEWAVPRGCRGPKDCKCCTSRCVARKSCKDLAGFCTKTNPCNKGKLYPAKCKGPDCKCCVKPKDVKASFKLTNIEYSEELRDQSSAKYIELKNSVEQNVDSALENNKKISGFQVEFFRNGSVIVDSKVSTTEENQEEANNLVLEALINSGVEGLDKNSVSVGVRLCVPAQNKCAMMKDDISDLPIICIEARDRYDCLQRLDNEEVDVVRGDPEDVYLANALYGDKLRVVANIRDEDKKNEQYLYRAVAMVNTSTITGLEDLKGKKSCHAGTHLFCSKHVPISKLLQYGKMSTNCSDKASVVENDLRTLSSYFGEACLPGKWVPDDEINARLKNTYNNLCSLCENPTKCDKNDLYAGHEGALKCFINSKADVVWAKSSTMIAAEDDKFFESYNVKKEHLGLLCPDGKIEKNLNSKNCYWAGKPWPAWIARKGDKNAIVPVLTRVMDAATDADSPIKDWAKDVLGIEERSIIKRLKPVTPYTYLNQADYDTTISDVGCEADNVRLCVDAKAEQKCKALAQVLKSRRVRPYITCIVRADEGKCVEAIASNDADIITLDGGDMFKAYRDHGLIPVISEVYGDSHVSYYAVAVVNADSAINSLADLQGKKSCHTGINKSAGWKVPVITLLDADLLDKSKCDYAGQVGNFFNQSCAPGAKSEKYDPDDTNPDALCNLCVGNEDGDHKCERSSIERYYGYTGAFRCLVENAGDVAFIKHTTVPGNTGLTFDDDDDKWNQNLNASDYKLLCKDGGRQEVSDYKNCYLATVPSHKVVTRNSTDGVLQEEIRILLLRAAETLPLGQDVFAMFGDYSGDRDIIFKSSATSLVNLREDEFIELLEDTYGRAVTKLDKCEA